MQLPKAGAAMRTRMASRALSSAIGARTILRVGGVPEHFNTPWHTAAKKGLFEQAGLTVLWNDFPGGTGAMMGALNSNEIDVALALTEGIVSDMHNPKNLGSTQLLGTYVSSPLTWGVHVASGSDITSIHQLDDERRRTRYAVSRMGSGSHLMACVGAHARGRDPAQLQYALVGGLDGARVALREGNAEAFLWERYTTQPCVDNGEFRRIGEVPTPWPCFSIAASSGIVERQGPALLAMLDVVRGEATRLAKSPDAARTIAGMCGLEEAEVREWMAGVRWACAPEISHTMLSKVMETLVEAGVLQRDELRPAASLVSSITQNADDARRRGPLEFSLPANDQQPPSKHRDTVYTQV